MTRPVLVDLIRKNPDVRDTAIVAFADRRTGVGLYAFVEADRTALEAQLRNELTAAKGPKPPEHIQVVQALPRDAAGKPRTEILQLVAMNQLDLIEPMMTSEADRAFLKSILESRKNLRDRFNFEAADRRSSGTPRRARHPHREGGYRIPVVAADRGHRTRQLSGLGRRHSSPDDTSIQLRNIRDLDARHSVHSVRSRRRRRGVNGSLSARDIRVRSRPTSASGRNTGLTSGGACASSANAVFRCPRASPIN